MRPAGARTAFRESDPLSTVRYRIAPRDLHAHLFTVECTVDDPDEGGQRFVLPTWTPGSYLIREFARHVVAVRASAGGEPLRVDKIAKDTW